MELPEYTYNTITEYCGNYIYICFIINKKWLELYKNKYKNTKTNIKFIDKKINMLEYIVKNKYNMNTKLSADAAKNGYLDSLKFLHKNNCPWDETTTFCAAYNGNFECLKYSYENGCPWNKHSTLRLCNKKYLKCFTYSINS